MSKHYEVHILNHKHPIYPTNYVIYYLDTDRHLCDFVRYCVDIKDYHLNPRSYLSWFRNDGFSIIDDRGDHPNLIYSRPPVVSHVPIKLGSQLKLF